MINSLFRPVGKHENCIQNQTQMKSWEEKSTKLLKLASGFMKVEGPLCNIWYQYSRCVIHSVVWTSRVPAVALKPHTLSALSPRSSTQWKPQLIAMEDPFISLLVPNQWHFPSQIKSRTALLLSEPTLLPLQLKMTSSSCGQTKLLLLETHYCSLRTNIFSSEFTVHCYHNNILLGTSYKLYRSTTPPPLAFMIFRDIS